MLSKTNQVFYPDTIEHFFIALLRSAERRDKERRSAISGKKYLGNQDWFFPRHFDFFHWNTKCSSSVLLTLILLQPVDEDRTSREKINFKLASVIDLLPACIALLKADIRIACAYIF